MIALLNSEDIERGEMTENRQMQREQKLRALGFDEPSDEQRKNQLAKNIAMLDWPMRYTE